MDINKYWQVTLEQNSTLMKEFFHKDAIIRWHNTNEQFNQILLKFKKSNI